MRRHIQSHLLLPLAITVCGLSLSPHLWSNLPLPQIANTPKRIRLGGAVHPTVKHRVEPAYPKEAVAQGIQGDVEAMVSFGTDGLVKNVKIISGDTVLADSVSMALLEWRYVPLQLNGTPVEVDAPITVTFKLRPKPSVTDNEHPVKGGDTLPRQ